MPLFTGSMTALVTPFRNGKVDEPALRGLIERQIAAGTSVVVPCGTTGESATLSCAEQEQVIRFTVELVNKRIKVLAGAGSNNTEKAIQLHRFCQKVGADGSLQVTPYYNKPSQEGLYQHFKAIALSADLPVVLYNVPGRTGVNLAATTVGRLAKIANIVGVKEASGNLEQAHQILCETPGEFSLLSGEDALTFSLYGLGAKGVISVTGNVSPEPLAKQYKAVCDGNWDLAKSIHTQLFPLHKALFVETNPVPVKAALALMGLINEELRLPLVMLSPENRKTLAQVLVRQGVIEHDH